MRQTILFPEALSFKISNTLSQYGFKLTDAKKLSQAVKQMSDFYIQNPDQQTPWNKEWCQIAQLVYFLPLNYMRASAVVHEANEQNFFEGFESYIEIGSGLGALSLHLEEELLRGKFSKGEYVEVSHESIKIHKKISITQKVQWNTKLNYKCSDKSLLCFSYSLTENISFDLFDNYEGVLIIEPSLQKDGRDLMALRSRLIQRGYFIWAPCTHQKDCPLLTHSQKDWCHDRIHIEMPDWYNEIESHLPFKNKTLTFSYLLARKKKPILIRKARAVGDTLAEKGKSKVLICKDDERVFLSWLHRDFKDYEISRGTLLDIPDEVEKKSNELRLKKTII